MCVAASGGTVLGDPVIESRGFVFPDGKDYRRELREVVEKAIEGSGGQDLESAIRRAMKNYLFKKTKQSPMIVPVVIEL